MTDNALVRARALLKEHGRGEGLVRAVDGIDLDVVRGERMAVMGKSGWPNPGLIWTTTADAESLATRQYPLGYMLNLKLTNAADAENFADRFDPGGYTNNTGGLYVIPWQMISHQDGLLVAHEQKILLVGSWLLALLAVGSLAIVAGGRMAEQNRRVGLLKAVGGTPARTRSSLPSPSCSWPSPR